MYPCPMLAYAPPFTWAPGLRRQLFDGNDSEQTRRGPMNLNEAKADGDMGESVGLSRGSQGSVDCRILVRLF